MTGRRCCSCRASWRRRTRADELRDKTGLITGAAGALGWLGRRRPCQRFAADAGVPPRALPAALQGARDGVERGRASARFSGGAGARDGSRRVRQCGAAAQCARVQNVRSGRAQSTHGTCSTKCQGGLAREGGAGN